MKFWRILILCVILISVAQVSNAYYSLPKPTGYVTDTGQMISDQVKAQLETDLSNFDKTTKNQIAVVTIPSLQNDTIETFASKLFADWGIGQKGQDNGILLLIAKDERQVRIEVGYGLEGSLTDAQSYWIIQNQIIPSFKQGNYDQGILAAVDSIKKAISGAEVIPSDQPSNEINFKDIKIFLYLGFFILIWLASVMAKSKSWWLGGIVGGVIGIIFAVFLIKSIVGLAVIVVFGALGLGFDYSVSQSYQASKKHGRVMPWWWGGGFGGGGFGGGSSGGFGGFGGGGSGGGGSSGGW